MLCFTWPFHATLLVVMFAGRPSMAQEPSRASPTSLTVRCVDASGQPIAGAEVLLFELLPSPNLVVRQLGDTLRAGADGHCAPVPIQSIETWREHWAYARIPNQLVGMQSTTLFGSPDGNLTVTLAPSRHLTGVVQAPAGMERGTVQVRITDLWQRSANPMKPRTSLPATTDSRAALFAELKRLLPGRFESAVSSDGTFHFAEVPTTFGLSLEAVGPGLAHTQWQRLDATEPDEEITIAMVAEAVFGGTTRTPDGKPAPKVDVRLVLASKAALKRGLVPSSFVATSDADGRFEIRGLPAGEFVLTVSAATGCRYPEHLELAVAEHRAAQDLRLEAGIEVGGSVRDADDKSPLSNVSITISADMQRFVSDKVMVKVRTDANGRFLVRVPTGPAWLTAGPRSRYSEQGPTPLDLTRSAAELREMEILLHRR